MPSRACTAALEFGHPAQAPALRPTVATFAERLGAKSIPTVTAIRFPSGDQLGARLQACTAAAASGLFRRTDRVERVRHVVLFDADKRDGLAARRDLGAPVTPTLA